ncbi:hypothetical protein IQ264_26210 [Phormidium sp. LEGE 05292]|uniref:hypothetical protein n=1 Tax=[Phormidium] sp. LEGE 05292 TaxID=767427 RepID=UPI00187F04A4|nr:hypothetical protein [Phormidium sp. LEGE 05292]MBE9228910.1 hypothetical protein [Phormidium sp. LEGE 05292]
MLGQSRWALLRLTVAQNPSTPAETLMQLALDSVFKIQLAVAKNPQTPANVLAVLAEHSEETIQKVVAEHPNTTEEILHQLFPTQQQLLRERQNLPTSILERFFREAATDQPLWKQNKLQYLLFKEPNTPTWILAQLANVDLEEVRADKLANQEDFEVRETIEDWIRDALRFLANIAKHPQVTREILEQISQYPNPNVKLAVAQNSLTPESLKMQLLEELSVNSEEKVKVTVAEDVNTPVPILEAMAKNEFYCTKLLREIRRVLASEYAANAHSFKSVADQMMSNLKHRILSPVNITVNVDRWMEIIQRSGVLEEPLISSLDEDDYHDWSLDELDEQDYDDGGQLGNLVEQAIPLWTEVLAGLSSQDLKRAVRGVFDVLEMIDNELKNNSTARSVAVVLVGNPNTPERLREVLKNQLIRPSKRLDSYDSDRDLFLALAYTPGVVLAQAVTTIPQRYGYKRDEVLADLLKQSRHTQGSQMPASVLEELSTHSYCVVRSEVAGHFNTPSTALERLFDDDYSPVRAGVAKNPNTPPQILEQMARREDPNGRDNYYYTVCHYITQRSDTPASALEFLASSPHAQIRAFVARNPNTPPTALEHLATTESDEQTLQALIGNSSTTVQALQHLAQNANPKIRSSLIRHPNFPVELWEQLAQDEDVEVRCAIASSSKCPSAILETLASDQEEYVRHKVAANSNTPANTLEFLNLSFNNTGI